MDVFNQNCLNDFARNGTWALYKEFKQYCECENYLTELPSKLRIPLAKLKMAAHRNWALLTNKTERAQRLCTNCGDDVEDEYHFVIICPLYSNLRVSYIRPYYYKKPSVCKFIQLMRADNLSILSNLVNIHRRPFLCVNHISLLKIICYGYFGGMVIDHSVLP